MADLSNTQINGDLSVTGNITLNRTNINTTELEFGADVVNTKKLNVETLSSTGDISANSNINVNGKINSMLPDGTSPVVVLSKTECPNLNVNYLQGYTADEFMKIESYSGKLLPSQLPEATRVSIGATMIGMDKYIIASGSYVDNAFVNAEMFVKAMAKCYKEITPDASNIATIVMDDEYMGYGVFSITSSEPNLTIEFENFAVSRNMMREIRLIIINDYKNTMVPDSTNYWNYYYCSGKEYSAKTLSDLKSNIPTGKTGIRYLAYNNYTDAKTYKWNGSDYEEVDTIVKANSNLNIKWPENIYWTSGILTAIDDRVVETSETYPQSMLSFKKITNTDKVIDIIDLFTVDDGVTWYGNQHGLNYKKIGG